ISAIDNLSAKCSGLLLRSSFAILAARARHLFNAAPMPAFSVASRSSNLSSIMGSDCLRAAPRPVGVLLSAPGSNWCRQTPLPAERIGVTFPFLCTIREDRDRGQGPLRAPEPLCRFRGYKGGGHTQSGTGAVQG